HIALPGVYRETRVPAGFYLCDVLVVDSAYPRWGHYLAAGDVVDRRACVVGDDFCPHALQLGEFFRGQLRMRHTSGNGHCDYEDRGERFVEHHSGNTSGYGMILASIGG